MKGFLYAQFAFDYIRIIYYTLHNRIQKPAQKTTGV
jgi:hypothetical protein